MQNIGNLGKSLIYSESLFSELIFSLSNSFLSFKSYILQYILFHNLSVLISTVLYQSKRLNSKENQTFLFHNLNLISTVLYQSKRLNSREKQTLLYVRVHLVMFFIMDLLLLSYLYNNIISGSEIKILSNFIEKNIQNIPDNKIQCKSMEKYYNLNIMNPNIL